MEKKGSLHERDADRAEFFEQAWPGMASVYAL
jgi:hypothetical protein